MTEPIRIVGTDVTDDEVRSRHEAVEHRLEELGLAKVRILMEHGGFPTQWTPIILAWLANDKLEKPKEKKRGDT